MKQIEISDKFTNKFLSDNSLREIEPEIQRAYQTLVSHSGAGNDFLGWIDLPVDVASQLSRIQAEIDRLKNDIDTFVVIGIGGSYLGARAVIEALASADAKRNAPRILYAGNTISEDYYWDLLQQLDNSNYAVAVISKSGTTTEPAIAFRIVKDHAERKYGKAEAARRIIAITDAKKGALHDIAQQQGYSSYVIPDNVGGRFSVFTPVGLIPIAMAGHSIEELLQGARDMRERCLKSDSVVENPALRYAALRNLLYRQQRPVEMLVSFEPRLRYISEWWKQLFGESEGKDGKGILPHSLCYTTDLHSMGQYVQDGQRILFETFLHVEESNHRVDIPHDEQDLDGLSYLEKKSLTEINHQAEQGTIMAHNAGGVPVIQITLPTVNAYYIGQLLYLFELACGVSGYTLNVNPFDQPGVEAYKRNMFQLLGKPGYNK